ncbi:molecular chaperone [Pedobacter hiemivivus]|uniref:Molecular chaperone n=1 Tax=Pedobacter hiemivivus TaxID=2530454 RepID=A0A4U1G266_9SPHI|nr:molecular chaperone [Pedobacter hiemivivus]TKC57637.1 molecular chaperone [Pedobacter hiemivivus]
MHNKAGIPMLMAFALTIAAQFIYIPGIMAQGNLVIMPRRVVFEDAKKRTQELNIANSGADTAKYLVSVIQYRMLENGNFELITVPDSGQYFADKNFRFFPRSVILAPNEAQTIKVQVINTGELKPGEYRSHLYFRAVAKEKLLDQKPEAKFAKTMTVHLVPTFGIAIPVIIRVGISPATVSISKSEFTLNVQNYPSLSLTFNRTGNASAYGDIKVNHISDQGKITSVGLAKGFAIYTPIKIRRFTFKLEKSPGVDYRKGKLQILYTTSSDSKPVIITESSLKLF